MSNLENNTQQLEELLRLINNLPSGGGGGSSTNIEEIFMVTATATIDTGSLSGAFGEFGNLSSDYDTILEACNAGKTVKLVLHIPEINDGYAFLTLTGFQEGLLLFSANISDLNGSFITISAFLPKELQNSGFFRFLTMGEQGLEISANFDQETNTLSNYKLNGQSSNFATVFLQAQRYLASGYNKILFKLYPTSSLFEIYTTLEMVYFDSELLIFYGTIGSTAYMIYLLSNNAQVIVTELATIEDLNEKTEAMENIANGKCKAYVFQSKLKLELEIANYKNNQLNEGDVLYGAELKIGDVFLIIDTGVPDYWWNGNDISELETTKVDLTAFYTKDEINNLLSGFTPDNSNKVGGYSLVSATSEPTIDDRSIITFVIEG